MLQIILLKLGSLFHSIKCMPSMFFFQLSNFEDFVASLNNQGFLLKKGPKSYQLQTKDY